MEFNLLYLILSNLESTYLDKYNIIIPIEIWDYIFNIINSNGYFVLSSGKIIDYYNKAGTLRPLPYLT